MLRKIDIDTYMIQAEAQALSSEQPKVKVGGVVIAPDGQIFRAFNKVPEILKDHGLRPVDHLDGASATVHFEINALINAGFSMEGSVVVLNDAPCPRCAAALVNAGVKAVCFKKSQWFEKRQKAFEDITVPIFKMGDVDLYMDGLPMLTSFMPSRDKLVGVLNGGLNLIPGRWDDTVLFDKLIDRSGVLNLRNRGVSNQIPPMAVAALRAKDSQGNDYTIIAESALTAGISYERYIKHFLKYEHNIQQVKEKSGSPYSFWIDPLKAIMIYTARFGIDIIDGEIDVIGINGPVSSRSLVNLCEVGPNKISRISVFEPTMEQQLEIFGVNDYGLQRRYFSRKQTLDTMRLAWEGCGTTFDHRIIQSFRDLRNNPAMQQSLGIS